MKPATLTQESGRGWIIEPLTQNQLSDLEGIPGLRHRPRGVFGSADAVAAAAHILKMEIPRTGKMIAVNAEVCGLPLKKYQQAGVDWLSRQLKRDGAAILADDLGLGKTLQAIATAKHMDARRCLLAVPRYVAEGWKAELAKWGETSIATLRSKTTKANKAEWEKAQGAKWVITSYEMAEQAMETCFGGEAPDFLIMDEAHKVKNTKAERTQSLINIARQVPYKLALTATPLFDRPFDFHGILTVLFGSRFGSRSAFAFRYCAGFLNDYNGLDHSGISNREELKLRLSYLMLRREKAVVMKELPLLTRQVIWIEASAQAKAHTRAAALGQSSEATYNALRATAEAKFEAAIELATQAKQFILFTYERAHVIELSKRLGDAGVHHVWIHGGLSAEQRQEKIERAKEGKLGIVATIDSLGTGVNLQGVAHVGIMHVLNWRANVLAQAEGRIHRIGQSMPVIWYYLACRQSIDEQVIKVVVDKLSQFTSLVGSDGGVGQDLQGSQPNDADILRQIFEELK